MPIELDEIQRVATVEVRAFIKRSPWSAHHAADMQQEVIISLLSSVERFDRGQGTWEAFAGVAAKRVIVRYLKHARVWRGRVGEVELTTGHESVPDERPLSDAQLADARVAKKVRDLLRKLDYSKKKIGLASALGASPRQVAAKARVPVEAVYYARAQMVRRAALSPPLKQLWKELRP